MALCHTKGSKVDYDAEILAEAEKKGLVISGVWRDCQGHGKHTAIESNGTIHEFNRVSDVKAFVRGYTGKRKVYKNDTSKETISSVKKQKRQLEKELLDSRIRIIKLQLGENGTKAIEALQNIGFAREDAVAIIESRLPEE